MSITAAMGRQRPAAGRRQVVATIDRPLLGTVLTLLLLGLVMVASASIATADGNYSQPFYFFLHQCVYLAMGLVVMVVCLHEPVDFWRRISAWLLLAGILLLALVLLPGIGHTVNGSTRWIRLGLFNLQVSELVKLFVIIYLAGYLVRQGETVRTRAAGFIRPMLLLILICALMLLQPDFGATVVLMAVALGMMFLAGARLWQFGMLLVGVLAMLAVLVVSAPYRVQRLISFRDPWADPFNSGFQLIQSLIAIGRGEWFGVGLGASVQKLYYLPEAHTDFLFAILAEELGLIGSVLVIGLFAFLVVRALHIGRRALELGRPYGGYLAYGIGLWVGLQAFINMGVNTGILPTKGLTLPLMSYGGSSLVTMCMAMGLLLRVDRENRIRLNEAVAVRGQAKEGQEDDG